MISFYTYDANGQIHSTGQCPEGMVCLQERDGLFVGVGAADASRQFVSNGNLEFLPARPSAHHVFNYATKAWVDPRTPETQWPVVRRQRDALLEQSDWTQLPDVPLATKERWAIYRQALRDVTLQPDPFSVVWPAAPG